MSVRSLISGRSKRIYCDSSKYHNSIKLKIRSVTVENFRSIKCATFDFKDLVILIGGNNTGKTNILKALNWFFSSSVRGMTEEDYCNKDPKNEIRITIVFDRLTTIEKADIRIKKYLIDGTLTVQKSYSCDPETGKYESKFSGLIREPKEKFLKACKFDDYKHEITSIVREKGLPEYFKSERGTVTQESYREGIKKYIEENRDNIIWDEPFFSSTHFLGWKEVAQDFMPHFFYVPAVKEASEEATYGQTNLFGRLIDGLFFKVSEGGPELSEVRDMLGKIKKLLNRPERSGTDKRPETMRDLEKSLLNWLQEAMPSVKDLEIQVSVPVVEEIVQSGTHLLLDDGIKTSVEVKGHGLQRSLIFAIFREYANLAKSEQGEKKAKPFIFAIEEPELYLHPHHQAVLFKILQTLSEKDQVAFCTHSPYFIDMSCYNSVTLVSKSDPVKGTEIFQCKHEIFSPSEKNYFKLLNEFNPERNEVFFARKAMLVEGPSEKVGFPLIAKKLGVDLYAHGVSIIECGGKANIPFFAKVLNAFKIPYIVVHDIDPIEEGETDKDSIRHFKLNETIKSAVDSKLGVIAHLDPEFDDVLKISKRQSEKLGKPLAVFNTLEKISSEQIDKHLKEIISKVIS